MKFSFSWSRSFFNSTTTAEVEMTPLSIEFLQIEKVINQKKGKKK